MQRRCKRFTCCSVLLVISHLPAVWKTIELVHLIVLVYRDCSFAFQRAAAPVLQQYPTQRPFQNVQYSQAARRPSTRAATSRYPTIQQHAVKQRSKLSVNRSTVPRPIAQIEKSVSKIEREVAETLALQDSTSAEKSNGKVTTSRPSSPSAFEVATSSVTNSSSRQPSEIDSERVALRFTSTEIYNNLTK